jgi:tetratricopeptide (TPR) repeat protein
MARAAGDSALLARALLGAGSVALEAGDLAGAESFWEESLARYRLIGQPWGTARAQGSLADVALARGDLARAEAHYAGRLTLSRQLRDRGATGGALRGLASVARRRGDHVRASAHYREGLALYTKVGQPEAAVTCLEGVAWALAALGHEERAVRLLGAAGPVRSVFGVPLPPADLALQDQTIAGLRCRLGEEPFATAWAAGQAMTLGEAAAEALEPAADAMRGTARPAAGRHDLDG